MESLFPEVPPAPRPLLPSESDVPPSLTARTLDGLEWLLARELSELGATNLRIGRRTIEFTGTTETLYRSVLESRVAIRILEPLGRFAVSSPESLYKSISSVDWAKHLRPTQTLRVDARVHDSFIDHSLYASQVVKDAVVDGVRAAHGRGQRAGPVRPRQERASSARSGRPRSERDTRASATRKVEERG